MIKFNRIVKPYVLHIQEFLDKVWLSDKEIRELEECTSKYTKTNKFGKYIYKKNDYTMAIMYILNKIAIKRGM